MIRVFKYRIYPNKAQVRMIDNQLFEACKLYNTALEHRIWVYRSYGISVCGYAQSLELKDIRAEGLCGLANFSACQVVLRSLDITYKAFFNRVKRGEKPGFPRFKSCRRYNTLKFSTYGDGCKVRGKKVYFQGVGDISMRLHRSINGLIKTMSLRRQNGKYYVMIFCKAATSPLCDSKKSIGIDVGLENFVTLSNGDKVGNPRFYRNSQKQLRILQRGVTRKQVGSKSRKKAVIILSKFYEKIADKRGDFIHKLSTKIVNDYSLIYVENLDLRGMKDSRFGKDINDASWGRLFYMLTYKAESAGKQVIKVDPRGTSQRCHNCGNTVKKKLSDRWHNCDKCGVSCHRDVNSAKEILRLGTSLGTLTCPTRESVVPEVTSKW